MSGTLLLAPPLVAGVQIAEVLAGNDKAVQYILSDVPLFTVGVFSMGVCTFLLILRKLTWIFVSLHLSILLAFTAALLDLVQVLVRGVPPRSSTVRLDTNPVLGLLLTREILYAVSVGFRLLFMWGFVACPPRGCVSHRKGSHSASWTRWGTPGLVLQWTLLVTIFAIMTLQILYRDYPPLQKYGLIYVVAGILEIVVSVIFVLKLFLNLFLVRLDSVRTEPLPPVFLRYLPFTVALAFNIGIAVGNLLDFLFSETVLGRFLLAVELYILILYILVDAFSYVPPVSTPRQPLIRSSSFRGITVSLSRESTFRVPAPRVSTPDLASALRDSTAADVEEPSEYRRKPLARVSARLSRLSNLLKPRRYSTKSAASEYPIPGASVVRPYYAGADTEKGSIGDDEDLYSRIPRIRRGSEQSYTQRRESETFNSSTYESDALRTDSTANLLTGNRTFSPLANLKPLTIPPTRSRVPAAGAASRMPPPTDSSSQGSPIYGLEGIVRPRPQQSSSDDRSLMDDPRAFYFDRSSGLSGLLRQQEELDNSIAALGLFAGRSEPASKRSTLSEALETPKPPSAARSDFSLSNFPEPPWGRKSVDGRVMILSPPSTNAERIVEVHPGDDSRSMTASQSRRASAGAMSALGVPPIPTRRASRLVFSSPDLLSGQASLAAAFGQGGSVGTRSSDHRRSATALQAIVESQSRVTPQLPEPSAPFDSSARPRRALPVPPQPRSPTQTGIVSEQSTSVPGLASRKIGLPSNPRLGNRREGMMLSNSNHDFERPRPAPSPSLPL